MTKTLAIQEYIRWLHSLIGDDRMNSDYSRLFDYLFHKNFEYIIGLDSNRAADGIDLRYRFVYEHKYGHMIPISYIDGGRACSVLEMMIALAIRCESIMFDPDVGDRTHIWFWEMITNLGLDVMTNDRFGERDADTIVTRLLNREYGPNGEGGLFTIRNCKYDLRHVEIWYQAMWYLDDYILCERSM